MRIFVALDLEHKIRDRICDFVKEVGGLAPGVRWVGAESLHVTLKFIGERPDADVKKIEEALDAVRAKPFHIRFRGAGFFPTAKAARLFWVGIQADPKFAELAKRIEQKLTPLGIAEEKRAFNPHLTLARARGGSGDPGQRKGDRPNRQFVKLQEKLEKIEALDFGTMSAQEFFLYRSQLSNKGSRYTKIARFALDEVMNGASVKQGQG